MTDDEARALGERLATLRAHRRGMTVELSEPDTDTGFPAGKRGVISSVAPSGEIAYVRWDDGSSGDCDYLARYLLPDLRDPATRGAALDVVRERWGDDGAYTQPQTGSEGGGWWCWVCPEGSYNRPFGGATEAEALVVALEAAP